MLNTQPNLELTEAELATLSAGKAAPSALRTKAAQNILARLAEAGLKWCRWGTHQAMPDDFATGVASCRSCETSRQEAMREQRADTETVEEYYARREKANERNHAYRARHPEKIAEHTKRSTLLRMLKEYLVAIEKMARRVDEGEDLWQRYLAMADDGRQRLEADPTLPEQHGCRPLNAWETDPMVKLRYWARFAEDRDGVLESEAVRYAHPLFGKIARYLGKAERDTTNNGIPRRDAPAPQHLVDMLLWLQQFNTADVDHARGLLEAGDDSDDVRLPAPLQREIAALIEDVQRETKRDFQALPRKERVRIRAQRAAVIRSLRVLRDEDLEFYEQQAATKAGHEARDRREAGLPAEPVVEAYGHAKDQPHPDALLLTQEELDEMRELMAAVA